MFVRRFNVAPTSVVPVLRANADSGALELQSAHWGFVPLWWKDAKAPRNTINARTEDIAQKPMWRGPIRQSRCLIPAEGWYEWRVSEALETSTGEIRQFKQPYFIRPLNGGQVCFAGLYSSRGAAGASERGSCAILTRASEGAAAQVHDRMPVVLSEAVFDSWTGRDLTDVQEISALMTGYARTDFECIPVSTRLNQRGADGADLIEPLT